ncbi:hypothetical protein GCM10017771_66290 [Streptomyces capitiformicae]|uniref:Lipoprotein n=1 Tax=Streptomyces capitiformicae TaxID=2014920 RepID=A0A918ZCC9_9ACTN|nr:hypothetical protein GCM10017771_66290 [Streptomyces capitiformicae]
MGSKARIRASRRWVCAAAVLVSTLAGCGGGDTLDAADTGAGESPGASESLSPGKNATDQPEPDKLPPARTPVLHVDGKYTYTVRILDAKTMVDVPGTPPPAGTMALALLLRVEAEPRDRSIHAPYAALSIDYPSRKDDLNSEIGTVLDYGMPYLTEDQMLYGGEGAKGIDSVFGTLQPNTVYYHWAWQIVSEKANLEGATLCEAEVWGAGCIPIGDINTAES